MKCYCERHRSLTGAFSYLFGIGGVIIICQIICNDSGIHKECLLHKIFWTSIQNICTYLVKMINIILHF